MTKEFRQFKLSNNQEIICKILEWDNEDTSAIIVKDVLEIAVSDDPRSGTRYIGFKPWLTHTGGIESVLTVNSNHIVAEMIPTKALMVNYKKTLKLINLRDDIAGVEFNGATGLDEEAFKRMLEEIKEIENEEAMEDLMKNGSDSDNGNVIQLFKGPRVLH